MHQRRRHRRRLNRPPARPTTPMTTGTTAAPTEAEAEAEAAKPTYPAASTPAVCDNPILCWPKTRPGRLCARKQPRPGHRYQQFLGLLARIDHLDVPTRRQGLREFPYQLGLVTGGQDEVGEALVGIDLHHVSENRTVSDQQQRLRNLQGRGHGSDASSAAQDYGLHVAATG